jgi:hypothetical protein
VRAFRVYLVALILCLGAYTLRVGLNHGWNLLPVFFGDMAAMTWPGQFNADFTAFLSLSGLWIAWRHHFSWGGVALGLLTVLGGMMVLAPCLLYWSFRTQGDVKALLLGERRART